MSHWQQREGGGRFAIWLIRTIALRIGRKPTRVLLYPITLYFFLRRANERLASRLYLERVLGRPVTHRDIFHHIHLFAATLLDRLFFLARGERDFRVEVEGLAELDERLRAGRGVFLIGSHQGSFEALRALGARCPDVPLRVVLDKQKTPALTAVLEALAPDVGAAVIDASLGGTSVALAMAESAAQGAMLALLADRGHQGEASRIVPFLGSPAPFPVGPWLLASALKIPVMLCMGIYLGGDRYRLIFESFAESIDIPRAGRAAALDDIVGRYASRIEHYCRAYPFNWFNFYDFWQKRFLLTSLLLLPLACLAAPTPDNTDAKALVASLKRPAPARTPFAEARFMKVLDKPLVVSGELSWLGGDRLERRVDKPAKEVSTIADGEVTQERDGRKPRTFSLKRAPQLKILLDSFVALLGGDASRLDDSFDVHLGRDADRWALTLTPRDARLVKQIASIQVYGSGNQPRCMRMNEADGDTSIDMLGELATHMPAEPKLEAVIAQCGGAM